MAVATVTPKAPGALCGQCPLANAPCVRSKKPTKLPVRGAIVSRSPGKAEVMAGEPMASQYGSGKIIDFLFKMNGVQREQVLLTNVVLCVAPDGKIPPEAIKACAPRLDAELSGIDTVIAAGSEAVGLLIGRGALGRHRGYRHRVNGRTIVATNNPAIVLHDDSKFPDLKRDFQRAFNPLPPPTFPTMEVIEDVDRATEYLRSLLQQTGTVVAADIESRGGLTHKASLISLQFSTDGKTATVLGERGGIWDDTRIIRPLLRSLFESTDHAFVWHGGKFDTKILRFTYGLPARVDHDTMLLSYALDERSGTDERVGIHGLDYLLMDTFGWPYYSSPAVERAKKTGVVEDYDEFYHYAGMDVGGTYQLFEHQYPRAVEDKVRDMYLHLLVRGNAFLTDVELNGMVYDIDRAADLHEFEVQPELEELTGEMRRHADNQLLNPASNQQMAHLLYDQWGIQHTMQKRKPTQNMPKPERSVDDSARKEILEGRFRFRGDTVFHRSGNLVGSHPAEDAEERKEFYQKFTQTFDRFQKLKKQDGTYLVGLIKRAELDEDSRIYTQLNLHGTNSGRLSSSKPNLQNITRSKSDLPDIRKLFRASPGRQIVQADFSQAELRCIAQFSGDRELTRIYHNDLSLHRETATRFFGADFTPEQYSTCKNVNFGVFYGQTAETFQEKHGIPKDLAEPYIKWVWETFKGVEDWENEVRREVQQKHILVSPFGRKRRFHLLTRENLQAAFREGINFYPQSTASDLTLCAAITLHGATDRRRSSIGILVHDSIVADVEESYIDEYSTICLQVMADVAKDELNWTLPFKAEIGVGPTWGEAK
jgi:uracil-DNA glycosylase family 4